METKLKNIVEIEIITKIIQDLENGYKNIEEEKDKSKSEKMSIYYSGKLHQINSIMFYLSEKRLNISRKINENIIPQEELKKK
jgi:hypothetical protein